MEVDNDQNNIRNDKRKLSESENEEDNCKKVHLEADLNTAATSAEHSSSSLQKSISPVSLDSVTPKESIESSNVESKEKEIPADISQASESQVMQHDADKKDEENISTKSSFIVSQSDDKPETKETLTVPAEISNANLFEQSQEVSSSLTSTEKTQLVALSLPPSNTSLIEQGQEGSGSLKGDEKTCKLVVQSLPPSSTMASVTEQSQETSCGLTSNEKTLISLSPPPSNASVIDQNQEVSSVLTSYEKKSKLVTQQPSPPSSASLIEQSEEASSNLTGNEKMDKLFAHSLSPYPTSDVDKEKVEENLCVSEIEKIEQSNIEDATSSDLKRDESKLDSTTSDLETVSTQLIENLVKSQESDSGLTEKEKSNPFDKNEKEEKAPSPEVDNDIASIGSAECKESPSFEGTLKNISPVSNIVAESSLNNKKCIVSTVTKPPLNIETTFVPIPQNEPSTDLCNELEAELDQKSEVSAMEVESNNHTPIEGSLVETPCDSGETSPSTSTPADSCQVSAAPSPLLKEDTVVSESLLDESSMDTKDIPDENEEDKELESVKPVRFGRRKKKTMVQKFKKGKRKSTPMLVDEETRMSATRTPELGLDEDSQSSVGTNSKKETRRYKSEVIVPESTETFTAEKVFEYVWPLEGLGGEHYFIQENISQYLGISSFKRRYPDLKRRPIESQEKEYLKDRGLVTEIACDLGLTAVRSEDMLDIMFTDFQSKYEELQRVLREKKEKQLKEKGKVEYQVVNLDKSKMKEYSRKAALNASKWNASFNRERHEERRYSFDLQTFTLHMPSSHAVKLPSYSTKLGSYPVAVLPGQYTDYCKIYSTNELKGMPLQSVLSGPFTAEELAADLQEDSDDDASAIASVGTCPEFIKEEPDIAMPVDPMSAEKQPRCKVCNGGRGRNKDGKPEPLIICGTCRTPSHPTCIDLTLTMTSKIESYSWQCMDCKTCAQCNDPDDEERMIFCDMCDRGYHIYCVGLRKVPNGRWHCKECAVCFTCNSRNPAGNEHIKNAEWQHEFKKDKDNKQLKYACTLCMPCDKYWKRRQFCSVCMKVYRSIPEDGMVRCLGCPKYVHKDGCSVLQDNERFCNFCYKSRNSTALTHSRIIAAAKKKMATGTPMWK